MNLRMVRRGLFRFSLSLFVAFAALGVLLVSQQQPPTNVSVNAKPATPTITSLNPTSGSVGVTVTITGSGFAATQGTGSVSFNGTSATITSWSSLSIVVIVPSGATTGNVTVTQNGLTSNGSPFTVTAGGCVFPSCFPDATNTGVPAGTVLTTYTGPCTITVANTVIDSKTINCSLTIAGGANNVTIKNSRINGSVTAGDGNPTDQKGLVIQDTEINCGCRSQGASDTPSGIQYSDYSLIRVNLHDAGHGAAFGNNVTIRDSYIHGLGNDTDAHKDGLFVGNGVNALIQHNTIECIDGPVHQGCTSAIGLLTDFGPVTGFNITQNLLNTIGSYCFYADGGPSKPFHSSNLTFTNNHFGTSVFPLCGNFGPVTYWDSAQPGMTWSGNVWHDGPNAGQTVPPAY